jgi:excisionase family DNA binding protein
MALEDKIDELIGRSGDRTAAIRGFESKVVADPISESKFQRQAEHLVTKRNALVTIAEAAEILSCSPASIRKWMQRRQLMRVKLGRLARLRRDELHMCSTVVYRLQKVRRSRRSTGRRTPLAASPVKLELSTLLFCWRSLTAADLCEGEHTKQAAQPLQTRS